MPQLDRRALAGVIGDASALRPPGHQGRSMPEREYSTRETLESMQRAPILIVDNNPPQDGQQALELAQIVQSALIVTVVP